MDCSCGGSFGGIFLATEKYSSDSGVFVLKWEAHGGPPLCTVPVHKNARKFVLRAFLRSCMSGNYFKSNEDIVLR